MRNFLIIPILFIFLVSCSNSEDFDIPKISKLEKLEQHSNQFIKGIYSYDNGIHVAIGYGIANSIMVEGEGGNIIIDTTDDVSQAKEVLSEFQKINQNPIKAIIYTLLLIRQTHYLENTYLHNLWKQLILHLRLFCDALLLMDDRSLSS